MNRVCSFSLVFVCALVVAGVVAMPVALPAQEKTAAATPRLLTVDDLFEIKRVQDPRLSPEGRWVAYTVTTTSLKDDKAETQIWMIPAEGGEAIPLTAKGSSASRPRWSPDGKYLAFLADRGSKTQVWLLDRRGGEAQQLTAVKQGVRSYEWSPDGKRLLLVVQDPKPEEVEAGEGQAGAPSKPQAPPPWVIDRLQFKQDYVGYLDRRRTHISTFDLASKQLKQVTSGDVDDREPAWSPDGRFIAFVSYRDGDQDKTENTDIWRVEADNPEPAKTLLKLTAAPGRHRSPSWSPDGKWVTYRSATDVKALHYATYHLAVVSAQGGAARILTEKLDRNVADPRFSADGQWVYFLVEDSGQQHLARIPARGGEIRRLIAGPRVVAAYDLSEDGTVVARLSEPQMPEEIFALKGGNLRQLTSVNDAFMAQIRLGEVEKVRFASKDGTPVEGFIYKPPTYTTGTRYPTLLRIHGGPVAQYNFSFNFEAQLFAANGYVVVMANPRGSSGYGQAFCQAIFADWGNKDYEDVMAGVDYAIAQGYADHKRLGVGGWSYGGILTNYVISKTDRFKAAISGASEVLYVANYGHDHYQRWWEHELGLPWKNRALWEKLSPFNSVENIVTPTLVIGGEKDWNVPIMNSEQLYQSLRRLGRTTQLVVYPGQFHGIDKPSYRKDLYERYLAWYGKYVKGEEPAPAGKPANETAAAGSGQ